MRRVNILLVAIGLLMGPVACSDDTTTSKPDLVQRRDLGRDGPARDLPPRVDDGVPRPDRGVPEDANADGSGDTGPQPDLPPAPDLGLPTNELVITEFMANPSAVNDNVGEWFEVHNPGAVAVDMNGWKVMDFDGNVHVIASSVVVPAKGYVVLGNNANPATNGGVNVAYSYGTQWSLTNGTDAIALLNGSAKLVDVLRYTAGPWGLTAGASLSLRDVNLDNNDPTSWCVSQQLWSGSKGDKGSPGAANSCAAPTQDSGPPPADQSTATALVITELMINPSAALDDVGEWFEVHNPTSQSVNLSGWTIASGTATHVIGTLTIAPGQYKVFARTAQALLPGTPYIYGTGTASDVILGNSGGDTLTLKDGTGVIVDEVSYTTSGTPKWTVTAGASLALKQPALDNSDPTNWCTEATVISTGTPANSDKGSPGAPTICQ